jgi:hypothetical protein
MGGGSRTRETFLHQYRSLVECRKLLSEEVWNAEFDRVLEQDSLGSHQEEVGSVYFSGITRHTEHMDFFRLPQLSEELLDLLKQTEKRLQKLPKPPPQNPVTEIIEMISGFSR